MPIDEPFEYLSFGGTFNRAFSIWLERFDFFSSIALIALIPYAILFISTVILLAIWMIEEEEIPDFHPKHIPMIAFIFGLEILVYTICTVFGRAAMISGVARMYVGQSATVTDCLKEAWSKKLPLFSVSLMVGVVMLVLGAILSVLASFAITAPNVLVIFLVVLVGGAGICAAVYVYIGIILANPAIMIEGFSGPVQGLTRSWELANGSRCYILCTLFCLWFLNDLVKRLLHNIFVGGDPLGALFSVVGFVVALLPLMIYFPMHSIMEAVMYLNLRIGRESMNHQVLSSDLLNSGGETNASRFRNDDYSAPSTDYRHVPLMDQEEPLVLNEMT